jgi:hypothetical protein
VSNNLSVRVLKNVDSSTSALTGVLRALIEVLLCVPPSLGGIFAPESCPCLNRFSTLLGFENFELTKMTGKVGERGTQDFRRYTDVSRTFPLPNAQWTMHTWDLRVQGSLDT